MVKITAQFKGRLYTHIMIDGITVEKESAFNGEVLVVRDQREVSLCCIPVDLVRSVEQTT